MHTLRPPHIERMRHVLERRTVTVTAVEHISPSLIRVHFKGAMGTFRSLSPDDYIKIFVRDAAGALTIRAFTPRRFDAHSLVLDFALHEEGAATAWARAARPGATLEIGGPKSSRMLVGHYKKLLLVGDLTSLPTIGRRIEEEKPGRVVKSVVMVPRASDEQTFTTRATHQARWVHTSDATDPEPLLAALRTLELPKYTYAWVAAERGVVRAVASCLRDELGVPDDWIQTAVYWTAGRPSLPSLRDL